jgi:hypothetical protein
VLASEEGLCSMELASLMPYLTLLYTGFSVLALLTNISHVPDILALFAVSVIVSCSNRRVYLAHLLTRAVSGATYKSP